MEHGTWPASPTDILRASSVVRNSAGVLGCADRLKRYVPIAVSFLQLSQQRTARWLSHYGGLLSTFKCINSRSRTNLLASKLETEKTSLFSSESSGK
jgi:hypothetical protein